MKEPERSALAHRFGVSKELILRYEQASSAYDVLTEEWRHEARLEAAFEIRARGEDCEPQKLSDEMGVIIDRIKDEQRENPIRRELDEVLEVIRTIVDARKSPI